MAIFFHLFFGGVGVSVTRHSAAATGRQGHAIELDDELRFGESVKCSTYNNFPLSGGVNPAFECAALEMWSFEDMAAVHARRLSDEPKGMSFFSRSPRRHVVPQEAPGRVKPINMGVVSSRSTRPPVWQYRSSSFPSSPVMSAPGSTCESLTESPRVGTPTGSAALSRSTSPTQPASPTVRQASDAAQLRSSLLMLRKNSSKSTLV